MQPITEGVKGQEMNKWGCKRAEKPTMKHNRCFYDFVIAHEHNIIVYKRGFLFNSLQNTSNQS